MVTWADFFPLKTGVAADSDRGGFGDIIDTENHGNALASRATTDDGVGNNLRRCQKQRSELYAEETCLAESDRRPFPGSVVVVVVLVVN